MRANYKLYRGVTNKQLSVTYTYNFETTGDFQTIRQHENGTLTIRPSFGISISNGFEKDSIYIVPSQYYAFTPLLETAIKLISEHLYELFPDVGNSEFEVDSEALERFMTEKALANGGFTIIPAVFVDDNNQCYPGLRINTIRFGSMVIPFDDAISISKLLSSFDPHLFSISMLRLFGKFD